MTHAINYINRVLTRQLDRSICVVFCRQ